MECSHTVCLWSIYLCSCLSPQRVRACTAPLVLPALHLGDLIGLGGGCVSARSSPELTLDFQRCTGSTRACAAPGGAVPAECAGLSSPEHTAGAARCQAGLQRQRAANPQPVCETAWGTDVLC